MQSSTKAKQQNNQNNYSYNILLMGTQYKKMQSTTSKTQNTHGDKVLSFCMWTNLSCY